MEIISIVNRKGGVGKTATAHALGTGLMKKGKRVLFIDMDSQANLTFTLQADQDEPTVSEILQGRATADECIQKTAQGDIIPGSTELAGMDIILTELGKEYRLKEAIEPVKENYDYIIIDTPAQLGIVTINALTLSDSAIIPVQADIFSIQGIQLIFSTIETVQRYCNKDLKIKGLLLTRYNNRAILNRDMQSNLEEIAKQLKTTLYSTPIRECISIKEAQTMQQDIFSYAPKSNASKDYTAFIEEYLKGAK